MKGNSYKLYQTSDVLGAEKKKECADTGCAATVKKSKADKKATREISLLP